MLAREDAGPLRLRLIGPADAAGLEAARLTALGDASTDAVRSAAEGGADRIALGMHGRSASRRPGLGPVADRALRAADVPAVLLPKPREEQVAALPSERASARLERRNHRNRSARGSRMASMIGAALALLGFLGGIGDDPFAGGAERPWADPPASDDFSFSFQIAPVFRWFTGHVQVREEQVEGTRLQLRGDLGLETGAGGNARFTVDAPGFQALGEVEEIFGWGGRGADQPFAWNGTVYSAPSQVRVHSSFLTVRAELAFKLWGDEKGRSWLGPLVGLEYPYYTVSVGTNLQHGSLEDWVHYLPYSVAGAAGRVALSDAVDLGGRVVAGYLPNLPTVYTEGGRLSVSVRPSVAVDVPITWHVGASIDLSFTFTYQYWDGADHSNEDGNKLVISSPGAMLGVAFRW